METETREPNPGPKTGMGYIIDERRSQIEDHGYSKEWQTANMQWYSNKELIRAGDFCYNPNKFEWPDNWRVAAKERILKKSRIGQLACAGAFYLAHQEIFGNDLLLETLIESCAQKIDAILKAERQ